MAVFDLQHRIRALTEPVLGPMGFDLVAVEWLTGQHGMILRLSIDKPGGVKIDDCVRATSVLSPLLDSDDPVEGAYELEVSSPGIDRPVQRLVDFERFKGFRCKLRLVAGWPRRRYTGEIVGVDGQDIVVRVDGAEHRLPYDAIEKAHLDLSLEEYQSLAESAEEHP